MRFLVGVTVGTLTAAAHGLAGGGYPTAAQLTLLLVVAGAAGAAARRVESVPVTAALLGAGQVAGHLVLSTTVAHQHAGGMNSWVMLAAHAVATVVCAALIATGRRLHRLASGTIAALLQQISALDHASYRPHSFVTQVRVANRRLLGSLSRRGPPVAFAR